MRVQSVKSTYSYSDIQELRRNVDCLMIDHKKLNHQDLRDSFQVDDETYDIRRQPLRLVVISLSEFNEYWSVLNDRFRRNTMIIASDEDVRQRQDIVRLLEEKGVALLMAKRNEDGFLSYQGILKSLTSLKFQSLLLEDKIDLLSETTSLF